MSTKYKHQYSGINAIRYDFAVEAKSTTAKAKPFKLNEPRRFVLNAAAAHPEGLVVVYPENITAGNRARILCELIERGWIEMIGKRLKITATGLAVIQQDQVEANRKQNGAIKLSQDGKKVYRIGQLR